MFLLNWSLWGSDTSLAHGSLSTVAVWEELLPASHPVTCWDAQPEFGTRYPWLSPRSHLGHLCIALL